MQTRNRVPVIDQNALNRVRDWQDHIRDPSLTALLVLELCAIFFAAPLAARGVPVARPVADALVLAVLVVVVLLSHRWLAITLILIGVTAIGASILPHPQWSPLPGAGLQRGGDIIVFLALIWVVAHAVYAPGRITFHRLQGAMVLYLSVATLFAAAYGLIWELSPDAFAHLGAPKTRTGGEGEHAVFQPEHADHPGLRRHRRGRSAGPQPDQSGSGYRPVFSCDHRRPPRNPRIAGPAQMTTWRGGDGF